MSTSTALYAWEDLDVKGLKEKGIIKACIGMIHDGGVGALRHDD